MYAYPALISEIFFSSIIVYFVNHVLSWRGWWKHIRSLADRVPLFLFDAGELLTLRLCANRQQNTAIMREVPGADETAGRGHREKKPSEKIKEQVTSKIDRLEDEKSVVLPTYIAPNDPKFFQEQKELGKVYDHTKKAPNGDEVAFYSLGTQ